MENLLISLHQLEKLSMKKGKTTKPDCADNLAGGECFHIKVIGFACKGSIVKPTLRYLVSPERQMAKSQCLRLEVW